MAKKWELKAGEKNLVSKCIGIMKEMLDVKRKPKYWATFDDTFKYFEERVAIAPEHWKRNSDGETKWHQAIRNAAKVKRKNKKPDALTQGELVALVDGGFALPNHVPTGFEVVEFPNLGGFKIKVEPHKKKKSVPKPKPEREDDGLPAPVRAEKAANRVRLLVRDFDESIRDMVVQQIANEIEQGRWFFESRFKKPTRRRKTDEE